MYKSMVLLSILMASVLIISNTVQPGQAFIIIGFGRTHSLAIICLMVGALMGYGIHGMIHQKDSSNDDDSFQF